MDTMRSPSFLVPQARALSMKPGVHFNTTQKQVSPENLMLTNNEPLLNSILKPTTRGQARDKSTTKKKLQFDITVDMETSTQADHCTQTPNGQISKKPTRKFFQLPYAFSQLLNTGEVDIEPININAPIRNESQSVTKMGGRVNKENRNPDNRRNVVSSVNFRTTNTRFTTVGVARKDNKTVPKSVEQSSKGEKKIVIKPTMPINRRQNVLKTKSQQIKEITKSENKSDKLEEIKIEEKTKSQTAQPPEILLPDAIEVEKAVFNNKFDLDETSDSLLEFNRQEQCLKTPTISITAPPPDVDAFQKLKAELERALSDTKYWRDKYMELLNGRNEDVKIRDNNIGADVKTPAKNVRAQPLRTPLMVSMVGGAKNTLQKKLLLTRTAAALETPCGGMSIRQNVIKQCIMLESDN